MLIRQPRPGDSRAHPPVGDHPRIRLPESTPLLQAALAAGVAGLGGAWLRSPRRDVAPISSSSATRSTA